MEDKKQIRKLIRERKKSLTPTQIQDCAVAVATHLRGEIAQIAQDAKSIGVFLSMPDELQTKPIIEMLWSDFPHLKVLVPRVLEDNQHILFFEYLPDGPHMISKYGIWEPSAPESEAVIPDILIMPGIAFDRRGGRVGHGGGFYDRYLEDYGSKISHRIAIAYALQILDEVPMEEFDRPVEKIVTEEGVIATGGTSK